VGQRFEVALAQHDGGPRYDIRSQRTLLCHLTKHTVQVTCNGPGQIDRMAHRHTRSIWPDGQQIHRLGVLVLRSTVFRDCSTSRSPNGWPGFDPRIPLIMSHHARRLMTVVFPATVPRRRQVGWTQWQRVRRHEGGRPIKHGARAACFDELAPDQRSPRLRPGTMSPRLKVSGCSSWA
jgi:hypothetical protein